MAFPQTVLPLKVEFNLGGWTDVTSYVRRDGGSGINITRGRANESAQVERTQATFTLENTDGRFSARNPTGPYYGLLSLNTPCRVSVTRDTKVLQLGGGVNDLIACPDAAALDIIGDIDIRVDAHLYDWRTSTHLACKWRSASGNQRSWALVTDDGGFLRLWWTTAGTEGTLTKVLSTARVPVTAGRLAVRATLDVNNGAGGSAATFYTSDTISGTWTQLGDPVVTSGATSIYSGTSPLEVGGFTEQDEAIDEDGLDGYTSVYGWMYAFQLRNGIGGAVVANPDFTLQSAGATSFADTASAPNTWTVAEDAAITDRWWRFHGEVSSWPQRWDTTGRDVTVNVVAAGPLRRLTQGPTPLRSVMYRNVNTLAVTPPLAYWPLEDAQDSTQAASGLAGGTPVSVSGTAPTWASSDAFVASEALPVLNGTRLTGSVPSYTATERIQFQFFLYIPSGGLGASREIARISTTSTEARDWVVEYKTTGSGTIELAAYDSNGNNGVYVPNLYVGINGKRVSVTLLLWQSGVNTIDYTLSIYEIGSAANVFGTGLKTGTMGVATQVVIGLNQDITDTVVGHISVRSSHTGDANILNQLNGYTGETAGARFVRLCAEEGIASRHIGDLADTELMGAQRPLTLIELLRDCANADLGMIFEPLDALALGYRTRQSLENQSTALSVDYTAKELASPPLPTSDVESVRNDVTASRTGGSSSRAELASGRMSTAPPPNGVGRYPASETVNVSADSQLPNQANLRLYLGTVDEERYPQIHLSRTTPAVVANATLNTELLGLAVGHVAALDNMPTPFVAPGQVRQLVQGWSERLANFEHSFVLNTTPASPWDFGLLNDAEFGRLDTGGSELATAVNSSATSLVVATTVEPYWTQDAAEFPFDLSMGGEILTATDIDPTINDTFTRSTSNGWGTATSGQAWTREGGADADFSVNGSAGAIGVTAVNSARWVTLAQSSKSWDVEFRSRTLVTATTQPINTYIGLMLTGTTAGYIARMAFYQDQSVRLSIEEMPFALLASEVTVGGLTHAANTWYRLRFQCIGGVLRARAWLDGGTEPSGWHVNAADTTYTSGGMGVRAVLTSGNTNALPVAVQYDDVRSHTPQTFTVTRSVNGVAKSHSLAADVRLTHPMIFGL